MKVNESGRRGRCSSVQPEQNLSAHDREHIDSVLRQEIGFVYNAEFEFLSPDEFDDDSVQILASAEGERTPYAGQTGSVSPLPSAHRLLTAAGEIHLFRKYNFLKFRANALRSVLDHRGGATRRAGTIEQVLTESQAIRELLASANLRLVGSIARRYSRNEHEFDELYAEGCLILLRAIEKFDYSRGFRFSTYATHSIQRHFFRVIKRRQTRKQRELASYERLQPDAEDQNEVLVDEEATTRLKLLVSRWDECLSVREQEILKSRFGLGDNKHPQTLKSISVDVGLSKERVRQIQMRALQSLREFAEEQGLAVEL